MAGWTAPELRQWSDPTGAVFNFELFLNVVHLTSQNTVPIRGGGILGSRPMRPPGYVSASCVTPL